MPGMEATARLIRSTTSVTKLARRSRGFNVMARRPALAVGFMGVTPTTEMTPVTSGSVRMPSSKAQYGSGLAV